MVGLNFRVQEHVICRSAIGYPSVYLDRHTKVSGGLDVNNDSRVEPLFLGKRYQNTLPAEPMRISKHIIQPAAFGGILTHKFGHFILESMSRFPSLMNLPSEIPIYYLSGRHNTVDIKEWQRELLLQFGIRNTVHILEEVTQFDNLIFAPIRFYTAFPAFSDSIGEAWLRSRFPKVDVSRSKKIYVSRGALNSRQGGILGEQLLEAQLRTLGYDVFYPEQHSIDKQIKVYQSASHIIVAESSAVHLLCFITTPNQKVAILQRRPRLGANLREHIKKCADGTFFSICAISKMMMKNKLNAQLFTGTSEIDFDFLTKVLIKHGFIGKGSEIKIDQNRLEAEREALLKIKGRVSERKKRYRMFALT